MSDKFFFKGRQDARLDHRNHGFKTNAIQKIGSKKFPLELTVNSEQRKQDIEKLALDNNLFANITIDASAQESIEQLTFLLDKTTPVSTTVLPKRNDPCHCGSGIKYKKCCS